MSDPLATSYDEVPYESGTFRHSHPDSMAVIATLFGMRPPAVEGCRVLELGCAGAGNLIPMALSLPRGNFLGIDLSASQIAEGQKVVDALGLSNIELRTASILDVDERDGTFDYIIAHGVYSWVPPEVQDKILTICARQLSPNGVAYVSYNTYPGWSSRGMVRDMMRFHVDRNVPPATQVAQAREFLDFLIHAVPNSGYGAVYRTVLEGEAHTLREVGDSQLFHEQLEEHNHPVYFREFVDRAEAKGLQFLAEARLKDNQPSTPPAILQAIESWSPDVVTREQYLDFVHERTFRRTLLCRADVAIDREPSADRLEPFTLVGHIRPASRRPDIYSAATEAFRSLDGATVSTNDPLAKAALLCLYELFPSGSRMDELWSMVHARLSEGPLVDHEHVDTNGRGKLRALMFQCCLGHIAEAHAYMAPFTDEVSTRPVASPLARLQAERRSRVTNLRHDVVELPEFDRAVLRLLDGTRDQTAVAHELERSPNVRTPSASPAGLPQDVNASLWRLAAQALLVA